MMDVALSTIAERTTMILNMNPLKEHNTILLLTVLILLVGFDFTPWYVALIIYVCVDTTN